MNSDNKLYKLNQQEEPYSNYQLFLTWVLQIVEYSLIIGGINSHREKRKKENPGGGGGGNEKHEEQIEFENEKTSAET